MKPRTICFIIGALSFTSFFLWVGFDFRWWAPVEEFSPRALLLFMTHVVGLSVGGLGLISWIEDAFMGRKL